MPLHNPEIYAYAADYSTLSILPSFAGDYDTGVSLAGVSVRWGREAIAERNEPTTATFQFYDPTGEWGRTELWLGRLIAIYYTPGTADQNRTFLGRITDLVYDPATQIITVVAVDWIGQWGNLFVGGSPMPLETRTIDRVNSIRARAGSAFLTVTANNFRGGTASEYNARMGPVDWDRRSLTEVLDETLDGIDYDWFPTITPSGRTPTMMFTKRRAPLGSSTWFPLLAVAAAELRMDGEFSQRIEDVSTAVAIQFNGGAGLGTYHRQVNTAAAAQYGDRTWTVTTHLYDPPGEAGYNVGNLAGAILNRTATPYWRLPVVVTSESLMATPGFAEHLLRRDINERVVEVAGVDPAMPFPLNTAGGMFLRIIGGEAHHDGKQWSFRLSAIRYTNRLDAAPPG